MIRYALKCECDHSFEAWFPNAAAYDDQIARGLVACPSCGGTSVRKALMAPAVKKPSPPAPRLTPALASKADEGAETAAPAPKPTLAMTAPEARRRFIEERLRALRAHVEATSDYVGSSFADEARKIHDGEAEARAIHGEATPEEAEALRDEGVDCLALPWIQTRDD